MFLRAKKSGAYEYLQLVHNERVNGKVRQESTLAEMIFSVPEILLALSKLYTLQSGDLVFMGTPAGVGPLLPGDQYRAALGEVLQLQGRIVAAV